MFAYVFAAWGGALLTGYALWGYGFMIAIAVAPCGGSALAACVAVVLYFVRSPRKPTPDRTAAEARHDWGHAHR